MLSLIKSKTKKQDGSSGRTGNGKLGGKRSRSLISRPIEVLTSANINKLQSQQQQQNLQSSQQIQNQQSQLHQESSTTSEQLLVNSSGETVLLQSGGGLSFGFTAMEIPNTVSMQRPASVMQPERPSSRSSNSSRR